MRRAQGWRVHGPGSVVARAALALLSFGLLVFSTTYAVHAFGATLLVGTMLAFLFAPIASRPEESR